MISKVKTCIAIVAASALISTAASSNAFADESEFLDNVSVATADLGANDIVYDQVRDLLYASIPSAAGLPNGNSIVTLDPTTLEVLERVQVGSEPSQLAISHDGSRIYVGINGAYAIRYYEPETGVVGPLQTLNGSSIAEDIKVYPGDAKTVIVSSDKVGSSAAGFLEVFNDSGQIDTVNEVYGSNSITFLDGRKLFGYQNYSSSFDSFRFNFDGSKLTQEQERRSVIGGYRVTVESSSGLVFATNGQVMNPETMTLVGRFSGGSGAVEASTRDGLAYFFSGNELKVFDVGSFLEIDSATVTSGTSTKRTLEFAGTDRLAFVDADGNVGVISGVSISKKPPYRMAIRGSEGDDECVFDASSREMEVNGITTKIPYEVSRLFFNGRGGKDSFRFISDENADEIAVLQSQSLRVDSGRVIFSTLNTEELEFDADESSNDISILFDSDDDDHVIVRRKEVSLETAVGSIGTNNVGRAFVYSSGGNDSADVRGDSGSDSLRVNFNAKYVRMTNDQKSLVLRGFGDVHINAGTGDDEARIFDSPEREFLYSHGDYNRLFDNDGNSYSFKAFDFLSVASSGGNDIAYFQKTDTSKTRGNATWSSIFDTFFSNNVYNFHRVNVRE